jgi:nucleoside-diphosphate-sugar epimerase
VADFEQMARVLREVRPDYVFHLASEVTGSRELRAVRSTLEGNLVSAVNLLELAVELGCERILLTGSLEEPSLEDATPVPGSPYAVAKWAATAYGRLFHALYEAPVSIVRVFMAYGPGPQHEQRIIPYVIRSLQRGEAPKLSSGKRAVDWIYVDDVVDGFLACARAPGAIGQTVDVGSGRLVTIRKLVEKLVSIASGDVVPRFGALPDRALERVCRADVQRTRELVAWSPKVDLEEGLERTLEWFAAHPPEGT